MDQIYNNFLSSPTDKHYSLDSEDDFHLGCRNVSHQQQFFKNYPHPDDHTKVYKLLILLGFKP